MKGSRAKEERNSRQFWVLGRTWELSSNFFKSDFSLPKSAFIPLPISHEKSQNPPLKALESRGPQSLKTMWSLFWTYPKLVNKANPNTPFVKLLRKIRERTLCNPKNTLITQNYFGIILIKFRILNSPELSKTYYCVRPSNFSEIYTVSLQWFLKITGSWKYNFLGNLTHYKILPQSFRPLVKFSGDLS
jgi:hypothetical protein